MVIGRYVHTIIERTAGNDLIQNLLKGCIVRVGLDTVGVGICITDPHTENLIRQFFICQRNINVRVFLPKLEYTVFVQILKPALLVFIGKGVSLKNQITRNFFATVHAAGIVGIDAAVIILGTFLVAA